MERKKKWENDHAINEQIIGCRLWIKEKKRKSLKSKYQEIPGENKNCNDF